MLRRLFPIAARLAIASPSPSIGERTMDYANIIVETHGRVGLIRLNQPQTLNALSSPLIENVL